jgi:hypothetical protein
MTLTYFISTNENGKVIGYGHGYGEAGMQPAINAYFTDYSEFLTRLQEISPDLVYAEAPPEVVIAIVEPEYVPAVEPIVDPEEEDTL